jgi:hypothetical protein
MLVRIALLVGLVYCAYLAGRQAVSTWYLRQSSAAALESAVKWNPANPQTLDDFGTLVHMYADGGSRDQIIGSYEAATRLSPENAQYWADLGAAYDWAGRENDAMASFQNAQQLFPNSPDINWRVANFYVRKGRPVEALQSLKKVLAAGSVDHREVFELAARATHDNKAIIAEALPPQSSIFFDYLNFCVLNDNIRSAEEVWHRLLELNLAFPIKDSLPYLDALIRRRELTELQESWAVLAARFPHEIPSRSTDANLIANASFEHDILNGGFDWRIVPTKGAEVRLDDENRLQSGRSLRVDFDATENPYYWHVFQYVRVRPGTRYHFSGYMRVNGITTDCGPTFQIFDAYDAKKLFLSADGLIGTSNWLRQEFHFKTPSDSDLLVVRVGRLPSQKLANKIGGTVWVENIRLEIEK